MKRYIFLLILLLIVSGCSKNASNSERSVAKDKNTNSYTLAVPINMDSMKKMHDELKNTPAGDPFVNMELLNEENTSIKLKVEIDETTNNMTAFSKGTIYYNDNKTQDFDGEGLIFEFKSPENGKLYYYTDLKDKNNNTIFLIMFSLEDKRVFIQSTQPVQLGEFSGYLAFGESFMNKKYWDEIDSIMKQSLEKNN